MKSFEECLREQEHRTDIEWWKWNRQVHYRKMRSETREERRMRHRRDFGFWLVLLAMIALTVRLLSQDTAAEQEMRINEGYQPITVVAEMPTVEKLDGEDIPAHGFADAEALYCADVPLSAEEQEALYAACGEFSVEYALMLGLIERETQFRNVMGDGGDSYGYCQVQLKWWSGLMDEIGAYDLNEPRDNFRTACAVLVRLFDRYGCGNLTDVLTAYNSGHGGESTYADAVLANRDKWAGVLGYE